MVKKLVYGSEGSELQPPQWMNEVMKKRPCLTILGHNQLLDLDSRFLIYIVYLSLFYSLTAEMLLVDGRKRHVL